MANWETIGNVTFGGIPPPLIVKVDGEARSPPWNPSSPNPKIFSTVDHDDDECLIAPLKLQEMSALVYAAMESVKKS